MSSVAAPASVTVVIATRNRAQMLARLLDALAAGPNTTPFEVIVVDDASTDGTAGLLAARSTTQCIRHLRLPQNAGPAVGRNVGWRAATTELVLFTDDDCVPQGGWVDGLAAALRAGADLVQGRTMPNPTQADRRGPWSRTIEMSREAGFYDGCNMGWRRDTLESVGGFDESFRFDTFGEDIDLAWRAKTLGARSTFAAEAVVWHEVWPSDYRAHLRDLLRRDGLVRAVARHPQVRAGLEGRWWSKRTHPLAVLVLLATTTLVLRPRRPQRWVLACVAIAAYHRENRPRRANVRRRDWPLVLPMSVAADVVETLVLARASAREGTLLL